MTKYEFVSKMQCLEKEYLKVKFKGTILKFQLKCSYYLQTLLNEERYILIINNFQKYEKQTFGSSYIRRHLLVNIFPLHNLKDV